MVVLKEGQSGSWLKVDDVQTGDRVTIKNEGEWQESSKFTYADGNPKQDFVITVEHAETEYLTRINKISRDEIIPAYGTDTKNWVGRDLEITIENYRTLGKKGIVYTPVDTGKNFNSDTQEWE